MRKQEVTQHVTTHGPRKSISSQNLREEFQPAAKLTSIPVTQVTSFHVIIITRLAIKGFKA